MEGIVDGGIGEQIGSESLNLHLFGDHGFHLLAILRVVGIDVVPQLQPFQLGAGLGPITSLQILCCSYYRVLCCLWWSGVLLLVVGFQRAPQDLRDNALVAWIDGLHGNVWNLQEHGADVLRALQNL
eukprot:Skav213341  [mRNA]  locus=scaffold3340:465442:471484:- [translate_table: standard]